MSRLMKTGSSISAISGHSSSAGFLTTGAGSYTGMHLAGVFGHHKAQGRHSTVGPVGHGEIHPVPSDGSSLFRLGRISARKYEQLVTVQAETVGFFESGQYIRAAGEFFGTGQSYIASFVNVFSEIVEGADVLRFRYILSCGNRPGVVGRGRFQPYTPFLSRSSRDTSS